MCTQIYLRSIQELMRSDDPGVYNIKWLWTELPNLALLTNSETHREVQVTYVHASVGNKSLGETVTAFTLSESLKSLTAVTIDAERAFAGNGEKIRLTTIKVLICAAVGDLSKSKNLRDWVAMEKLPPPPLLTKAVVLEGETAAGELLNKFTANITESGSESTTKKPEGDSKSKSDGENTKYVNEKTMYKSAMARGVTDEIAADCDNIIAFLQAVAVKAPRVAAVPLSLRVDKRAWAWFRRWSAHHLSPLYTPINAAPQHHSELTGVLSDAATWLQKTESLRPVVAAQRNVDR